MKWFRTLITSSWPLVGVLLAVMLALTLSCAKKEPQEMRIGAVLPLTGDAALAGVNTREGIALAVDELNSRGGIDGARIKVLYEDTQADPKVGVAAITKLISVDHVPYVIDNSISSVTLAMAPIAEKNRVVLLATGATAPTISEAGEYIFRIWNSDDLEGREMARYAIDSLRIAKVAVLYTNNDYGVGLKNVFHRELRERNLDLSAAEPFEQGEQQYRSHLTKLMAARPGAIYVVGYSKDCIKILQQARELGYRGIWLGTTVMLDPTVIDMAKKADFEVYYPIPVPPDTSSPPVSSFRKKFLAKYQKEPPALSDVGFDAIMLLEKAVRLGGGLSGEDIQRGLVRIKGYEGASGMIEFDDNGDVHKPIAVALAK
jgi:branched-chain amino acid transport system substrate-binding protein